MKFSAPYALSAAALAGALAAQLPLAAQSPTSLKHDGQFWVQTSHGTLAGGSLGRLRITAIGNIELRGDSNERIVYTLTRRMHVHSEQEARTLLRGFEVRTTTRGDCMYLTVTSPAAKTVSADMTITVPRSMREAWIATTGGNVQAYDFDGHVEVQTRGGQVQMDRIKQSTTVRAGGGNITIGTVAGPVKCYSGGGNMRIGSAGGESWFETTGGEVYVGEVLGPIHVSTGAGNIKIVRSMSSVFARTAGGVIEVDQAKGLVSAQNSGGAIQVNSADGVRCESNSGTIRLRNVQGPLRAITAAGNIVAELLSGRPIQESTLSTNAGDITVYVPSNLAMTVLARNESNGGRRIVSDFPEIRVRQNFGPVMPLVAEGAINGGGPLLHLVAGDGTIYVRREK